MPPQISRAPQSVLRTKIIYRGPRFGGCLLGVRLRRNSVSKWLEHLWIWGRGPLRRRSFGNRDGRDSAVDDTFCGAPEWHAVVARVPAECAKCLADGEVLCFREHAFGLFEKDASVEGNVKLFGDDVALPEVAFVQDSEDGEVRECLDKANVAVAQVSGVAADESHRADDFVVDAHRGGVH